MDYFNDISDKLNFLVENDPTDRVFKLVSKLLKNYRDLQYFAERLGDKVNGTGGDFLHYKGCELLNVGKNSDNPECACSVVKRIYYELLDSIETIEKTTNANRSDSKAYWTLRL